MEENNYLNEFRTLRRERARRSTRAALAVREEELRLLHKAAYLKGLTLSKLLEQALERELNIIDNQRILKDEF